jgi:hypothetical protein
VSERPRVRRIEFTPPVAYGRVPRASVTVLALALLGLWLISGPLRAVLHPRRFGPAEILALGSTHDLAAAARLSPLLSSRDPQERALAAYALGRLRPRLSTPDAVSASVREAHWPYGALAEAARHDPSPAVRYGAVDALGGFVAYLSPWVDDRERAEATVSEALRGALAGDASPVVRGHAALALAAYATLREPQHTAGALGEALRKERDPYVRARIAGVLTKAFGRIGVDRRGGARRSSYPPAFELPREDSSVCSASANAPAVAVPALAIGTADAMNGPAPGPHPRIKLITTKGCIVLRLYPEWAPATVNRILAMVRLHQLVQVPLRSDAAKTVRTRHDDTGTTEGALPVEDNPLEHGAGAVALADPEPDAGDLTVKPRSGNFLIAPLPDYALGEQSAPFGRVEYGYRTLLRVTRDAIVSAERIEDD